MVMLGHNTLATINTNNHVSALWSAKSTVAAATAASAAFGSVNKRADIAVYCLQTRQGIIAVAYRGLEEACIHTCKLKPSMIAMISGGVLLQVATHQLII